MKLKSYASYFVSYLLNNLKNLEMIERIVLFGSVAKDQATKESDVDIFIEVKKKTKALEEEIRKIEEQFYQSREAIIFKAREINNPLSIKMGKLNEWPDLSRSIASTGIIFYGPYKESKLPQGLKHFLIVFWDKIGKNRGAFLNKLYGFSVGGKRYKGLIEKFSGKKLGKSCIMIPIEYRDDFIGILQHYKVNAKIIEVYE